jgi:hypothetical protein
MSGYEQKALDKPDERRDFEDGHVSVVRLGDHSIGRTHLEPGWKWSTAVKPIVGTDLCEVPHVGYVVTGRLGVRMADGTEFQLRTGDAYALTESHDAWVEGDEPFEGVEFESLTHYAERA